MSSSLIPILLALLAYIGWGFGDFIGINVYRKNNPSIVTFNSGIYRILIWLILLPFFYKTFGNITLIPLLFNLLAGLGSGVGYYFYGKAAKLINPTLVTSFSGAWGASALIISLVFLKETISYPQWVAILTIFTGLFLTTFRLDWFKGLNFRKDIGLLYALFTLITWGICGAFLKIPAVAYGWYWTSLIMLFPYFLVLLFEIKKNQMKINFRIVNFKLFFLMILLTIIADLGYNSSFSLGGSVAIVGTIAGSYATLSTLLAYFIYKEPLNKKQVLGIIITLSGIVLTAYFSSI